MTEDMISVVIPHAGAVEPLRECHQAIRKSHLIENKTLNKSLGPAVPYEVIVVTDKPSRETAEYLDAHAWESGGDIQTWTNDEYVGTEKALNQGLKMAKGNYLMFLMTDVRLFPGALLALRNALRERPLMGWAALPCKQTGFLAGCSMWTRGAFEKVGMWDEAFVSGGGFSDDDYLRRMWRAGYAPAVVRVPGKLVEHVTSESGSAALLGPEEKTKRFEQNKALFEKKWGATGTNWDLMANYVPPAEMFREQWIQSKVSADEAILEVGCAENPVWKNTIFKVTTCDISARPEEDCKPDIVCDAAHVPLPDKSFDVVSACELLEHVEDPLAVLKEAVRLARYRVVVTVPNEHEWPKGLDPFTNPGHVRFYDKATFRELVSQLGLPFVIEDIRRAYWWHFGAVITVQEKAPAKPVCLNLGSFVDTIAGEHWMNIDILDLRDKIPAAVNFLRADLTRGLPMYANDSVDIIRASHVLEHLTLEDAQRLLADCHRVLRPGGLIRIAVPDLDIMIARFRERNMAYFNVDQPLEFVLAPSEGERFSRLMFSGDYAHKAIYDYPMLESSLRQAGFGTVVKSVRGFSHSETLQMETKDQHPEISLYAEAIK